MSLLLANKSPNTLTTFFIKLSQVKAIWLCPNDLRARYQTTPDSPNISKLAEIFLTNLKPLSQLTVSLLFLPAKTTIKSLIHAWPLPLLVPAPP